jgi:hypothetical protein
MTLPGAGRIYVALSDASSGGSKDKAQRERPSGGDDICSLIRRAFERITGAANSDGRHGCIAALLHDVGELMGEQPPAVARIGAVASIVEDDVRSDGVGPCIQGPGGASGQTVDVKAYTAEVATEAILHLGADGGIEWYARRAQNAVNDRREMKLFVKCHSRIPLNV